MKEKMEKLVILVLVMFFATSSANAKLVAHWKFDESEGATAADETGNNPGVLVHNSTWQPTGGRTGGAIEFKLFDYISVANESNFDFTGPVTIATWMNMTNGWKSMPTCTIVRKSAKEPSINFRLEPKHNLIDFRANNANRRACYSKDLIDTGKWHHLAGVYDGDNIVVYLDGIPLDGENRATGGTSIKTNDDPLIIGDIPTTRKPCFFMGKLDDLCIFDNALSPEEITKLYTFGVEPLLNPLWEKVAMTVGQIDGIFGELSPQETVAFFERKISEYEQGIKRNPDNAQILDGMMLDLGFQLVRAKYLAGDLSKTAFIDKGREVLKSDKLTDMDRASVLTGLYQSLNTNEYEVIVKSVIQDKNYSLSAIASKADSMARNRQPEEAIKFLEINLSAYLNWQKEHRFDEFVDDDSLPGIYYLLAKTKENAGISKKLVAQTYGKTFSSSRSDYSSEQTTALIWLLDNNFTNEYTKIIRSFVLTDDVQLLWMLNNSLGDKYAKSIKLFVESGSFKTSSEKIVSNIFTYFETKKDWSTFERFLNALFTQTKHPVEWAKFTNSCLVDKTTRWAKTYFDYLNSKDQLKFLGDRLVAEQYMADGKFKKAADWYRDILSRCGPNDDKGPYEFGLCKCLFYTGKYREAVSGFKSFIANNKANHRTLIKEAMQLKGQGHVQLDELDKAIKSFITLMAEYPELEKAPEIMFFVGYCYMLQGKYNPAKEVFDAIVKSYPDNTYAAKAAVCMARINSMTKKIR
ncbi:LamG-like jellyroll fold domain-containing protein [Planctomycetota bacterium]